MSELFNVLGVPDPLNPFAPVGPAPKLTRKAFCREILASPEYRASILRRVGNDTLPAAVETLMYYYADGKPTEHIEVKDTTAPLASLSADDLEQRAQLHEQRSQYLATLARQLRQTPEDGASIH